MTALEQILANIPGEDWDIASVADSDLKTLVYNPPESDKTWMEKVCITSTTDRGTFQIDVPTSLYFGPERMGEAVTLMRDVWMLPFGFYGFIHPERSNLWLRKSITILNPAGTVSPEQISELLMEQTAILGMRVDDFCSVVATLGYKLSAAGVFDVLADLVQMPDVKGIA